jgi:DNA helicase-2/ATP-dependent DNA helicase PcrA
MEKTANFKPSKYQIAIQKAYSDTEDNLLISAVAGSGKTTTLLHLLNNTDRNKKLLFAAFNKHIADHLKTKITPNPNFTIGTIHSIGFHILSKYMKTEVSKYKYLDLLKPLSEKWPEKNMRNSYKNYIMRDSLCDFYEKYRLNNLYGKNIQEAFKFIMERYPISLSYKDIPKIEQLIWEADLYNKNYKKNSKFKIDFVDMITLPLRLELKMPTYDIIFIDECQDLSSIQIEFIKKMRGEETKMVMVGDPKQQIYAFGGSDVESWNKLKEIGTVKELPLSVCYRCATSIADIANSVWQQKLLESPDWMEDGIVEQNGNLLNAKDGDFVLCRNTRPLIDIFYHFLDAEKPSYIKGSEIGKGLISEFEKYKNLPLKTTIKRMRENVVKMSDELKKIGIMFPDRHPKVINALEKIEIATVIEKKCESTLQAINFVNSIFKENGEGIILSTIHKSKGLESDVVYFYRPDLIPSSYATTPQEIEQEYNLYYVAVTRAKKKLVFVENMYPD